MATQQQVPITGRLYARLAAAASLAGQPVEELVGELLEEGLESRAKATLFVSAPILGLAEGLIFGDSKSGTTVGEALHHGDFGLGTLNGLDGEVVVLDGEAYQITASGACLKVPHDAITPYMCLVPFDRSHASRLPLTGPLPWAALEAALQEALPSPNLYSAVLVEGRFTRVHGRSALKQSRPRKLIEAVREEAVFELGPCAGSIVGFYSPPCMGHALTMPGWHLHFLSEDRARGGHVFQADLESGEAHILPVYATEADMKSAAWLCVDLSHDPIEQLEAAETGET